MMVLSLSIAACAAAPPTRPLPDTSSGRIYPYVVPVAAADTGFVDVSGVGVVMVEPDRAKISFAVESEGETAQESVRDNATRMTDVIEALEEAAPGLDLSTNGYNVQPRYRRVTREGGEREISGYTTVNHIEVTTDHIEEVGTLIDIATGAGANRVASLVFMSSDIEAARQEALRLAVLDAQRQAETMASALGLALGPPLEVRGNNQHRQQDSNIRAMSLEAATPIAAGDQAVRANVTIRFRLGSQ
jgi:hypothetical protein